MSWQSGQVLDNSGLCKPCQGIGLQKKFRSFEGCGMIYSLKDHSEWYVNNQIWGLRVWQKGLPTGFHNCQVLDDGGLNMHSDSRDGDVGRLEFEFGDKIIISSLLWTFFCLFITKELEIVFLTIL